MGEGELLAMVGRCFVAAAFAPWLIRAFPRIAPFVLAWVPFAALLSLLSAARHVATGATITHHVDWAPSLGLALTMRLDGLGLLFGVLITGIGTLIILYAAAYLKDHQHLGRLMASLLAFMGAMLGLVLADNILLALVFWELTSITSYLLIGFYHAREKARKAALQALLVTSVGGLALMAGLVLLGITTNAWTFSDLAAFHAVTPLSSLPAYPAILALIIVAAATKSALFPFHFWLPNAMEAPAPVSAYLHSSTMVKAGVFLLARFAPTLGGTSLWSTTLITLGTITMVLGAILALRATALKKLLAYTTVSALGTLTLGLGIGTPRAIEAAAIFLLAHALYKGALFMIAGAVEHHTHQKDAEKLSGLARSLPVLAAAAVLAGLSMAGAPPLAGFIAKELTLKASLAVAHDFAGADSGLAHQALGIGATGLAWILTAAVVLASALTVAVALLVAYRPFFARPSAPASAPASAHNAHPPDDHHHTPVGLVIGPIVLASLSLLVGLLPATLALPLVAPAASSILAEPVTPKLSLWYGWTLALGLSAAALLAGSILYAVRRGYRATADSLTLLDRLGPARTYDRVLTSTLAFARSLTATLQHGRLRTYVLIAFATVVTAALATLLLATPEPFTPAAILSTLTARALLPFSLVEALLAAVVLGSAIVVACASRRLTAIAALSLVGFGVSLLYVVYGAPDLAMTQVAVEALSLVLLLLAFRRLPDLRAISSTTARTRDALIASTCGIIVATLVFAATNSSPDPSLRDALSQRALPEGFGRNVVNVILVDFRALDTLGEITVLGLAALGVYALLRTPLRDPAAHIRAQSAPRAAPLPAQLPAQLNPPREPTP